MFGPVVGMPADLTFHTACARLVALAKERGGEDHITLILARLDGPTLPALEPDGDRRIKVEHRCGEAGSSRLKHSPTG